MTTLSPLLVRRLTLALVTAILPAMAACEGQASEEELGVENEPALESEVEGGFAEEGALSTGFFSDWDADDDTYLSENEFQSGWSDQNLWGGWDTDSDSFLGEEEFNTAFAGESWYDESLYGDWDGDGDGQLAEDEFTTGLYDAWDANDDQQLAQTEFDTGLFE